MAKYVVLPDLDELARKARHPGVKELIEGLFPGEDSPTDQQSTSTDTTKAEPSGETGSEGRRKP